MKLGYTINLKELCLTQPFTEKEVVSAKLIFPKGAVPNSLLMWIKVDLTSEESKFITLPLIEFYRYIDLPLSSIGGWTDGEKNDDYSGLNKRYTETVADDESESE